VVSNYLDYNGFYLWLLYYLNSNPNW
jgi:hypothetical protein